MNTTTYKLIEFFILFILVPVSFAFPFYVYIKLVIGLLGFFYIIYILLRVEKNKLKIASNLNWKRFWNQTFFHFIIIAIITTLYMYIVNRDHLFIVILKEPKMWIGILFIYTFLSVYPQELIYRTFFFQRYESLFYNKSLFVFINAIVFSLAHFFFKNTLVIGLTFIGSLLFALTYYRTRSTVMVSIEHAIYGCWLFTVGMGSMLGFPMPS